MARVMFYTGICMLCISATIMYLPTCFSFILAGALAVLLIFLIIFKKKIKINGLKSLISISLVFVIFSLFTVYYEAYPAEGLAGYKAEIVCTVTDYPEYYDTYTAYTVESESIKLLPEKGQTLPLKVPSELKMRLTDINGLDLKIFDKAKLQVTLNPLGEYKPSSYSEGIYIGGYIDKLGGNLGQNRPFYAVFYDFREYLNDLIYNNISYEDARVISAAVLGDMNRLDENFYNNAKAAGVSHVLVVSGMHLGIVFQVLSYILGFLKIRGRRFAVILMFAVFAVTAICGFTPSILRAGLTYFILAMGLFFYRRPDPLNSLGLAAVIILFSSPFSFGNVSLMLSLASTFGLLYLCPYFYEKSISILSRKFRVYKPVKALLFSVIQTLSASFVTLPICVAYFGYLSIVSVVANLFIGYPVTLLLSISLLAMFALMLPGFLKATATLPIIIASLLCRYTVAATNFFGSLDFAVVNTNISYIFLWLVLFILILALRFWFEVKPFRLKTKLITATSLILVTVISFVICYVSAPKNRFAVLDVGKGSASVLCFEEKVYVIGGGDGENDAKIIENYLLSAGKRKIDYLILPTLSKNYAGGVAALDRKMKIDRIISPTSGDFISKISHIKDSRYGFYENYAEINLGENNHIVAYSDEGCVIRIADGLFAVQCGDFNFKNNKNMQNLVLVTDVLPNENILDMNFKNIIISGDSKNSADIKIRDKRLNNAIFSDTTQEYLF